MNSIKSCVPLTGWLQHRDTPVTSQLALPPRWPMSGATLRPVYQTPTELCVTPLMAIYMALLGTVKSLWSVPVACKETRACCTGSKSGPSILKIWEEYTVCTLVFTGLHLRNQILNYTTTNDKNSARIELLIIITINNGNFLSYHNHQIKIPSFCLVDYRDQWDSWWQNNPFKFTDNSGNLLENIPDRPIEPVYLMMDF